MKKLFVYLRDYRKESVLGPLFKLLEAGFELIVPLVVAAIIDQGIGGGDRGAVIRWCLALVALGLILIRWDHSQDEYRVYRDRLHYLIDKRFRGELNKCEGCKLCR